MFVVYVNHPNNKAFIHRADCDYYLRRKANRPTGSWSSLYSDHSEAHAFALATRKRHVHDASCCL